MNLHFQIQSTKVSTHSYPVYLIFNMLSSGSRIFAINRQGIGLPKSLCNLCCTFHRQLNVKALSRNLSLNELSTVQTFATKKCAPPKRYFATTFSYKTNENILHEQSPPLSDSHQKSEVELSSYKDDPLNARDYFGVNKLFTIKDLFNARVHLGHTVSSMLPQMKPFIYGTRFNTCIFDLDETALLLTQALNFIAHVAHRGGIILFVARQPQISHLVERTAIECGEYAQCRQWSTEVFTIPTKVSSFRVNPL
jgi:hypothetical protein